MADTFYFSRDTKVHLTDSAGAIYNIPVLDGFSFSGDKRYRSNTK